MNEPIRVQVCECGVVTRITWNFLNLTKKGKSLENVSTLTLLISYYPKTTIPTNPACCDGAVENLCLEYPTAGGWLMAEPDRYTHSDSTLFWEDWSLPSISLEAVHRSPPCHLPNTSLSKWFADRLQWSEPQTSTFPVETWSPPQSPVFYMLTAHHGGVLSPGCTLE